MNDYDEEPVNPDDDAQEYPPAYPFHPTHIVVLCAATLGFAGQMLANIGDLWSSNFSAYAQNYNNCLDFQNEAMLEIESLIGGDHVNG